MGDGAGADVSDRGGGAAPPGSVTELAQAVIRGDYGNGDARRAALGSRYDEVQAEVNRILGGGSASEGSSSGGSGVDIEALAQAVIRGDYGNGDARRAALGTNYDAAQTRVNEMLLWRARTLPGKRPRFWPCCYAWACCRSCRCFGWSANSIRSAALLQRMLMPAPPHPWRCGALAFRWSACRGAVAHP